MSLTIDFGIDLGTTNSLIAKYSGGKVEIFKNPVGHKETLPSVVAFRNNRIIVGDKAKEYIEKDSSNVFSAFKRKMGTTEEFSVPATNSKINPIQLSALVLKELRNFIYTGENVNSVVVTIPASFDTIQSNATKKAGFEAGFKEVVLLQEPIAASLAYANSSENKEKIQGQWLVYDLGGGTFDVALIKIEDDEMKIVDHEGNNFLGGIDFDKLIVENLVFPYLRQIGTFHDLDNQMKSSTGKYNRIYYVLLHKAEEVKIQLSHNLSSDIEFEIEDDNGKVHDVFFQIQQSEFEALIYPKINATIEMISGMLSGNSIETSSINYVLMVGGSTYIPLVKRLITEKLGIKVDSSIDPTTAVAVGAAYYAGTKNATIVHSANGETEAKPFNTEVKVRMGYQKTSHGTEEYFVAEVQGTKEGTFYRITRLDGAYDSGLKPLQARITEMLPLLVNSFNTFELRLFDKDHLIVNADIPKISILQGKFNVVGQPLPNDICIEVDDFNNNTTKLEVVFEKNSILPIKKTITRTISRNIFKNSRESLIINVLEGDRYSLPASNQAIGIIEIKGTDLNRDLVKGSDVEITLEISESRDLKIATYLLMTDQEFGNVFNPSERQVNLSKLKDDTEILLGKARQTLNFLQRQEKYEDASFVVKLVGELEELQRQLINLAIDDTTDLRYQLEDIKRKVSRQLDSVGGDSQTTKIKAEFFSAKAETESVVNEHGNEIQKAEFKRIAAQEKEILATNNQRAIKNLIDQFQTLTWKINQKNPTYLIFLFFYYKDIENRKYKDVAAAKRIVDNGEKALERKNYDELLVAIYSLYNLLPPEEKAKEEYKIKGTGLG